MTGPIRFGRVGHGMILIQVLLWKVLITRKFPLDKMPTVCFAVRSREDGMHKKDDHASALTPSNELSCPWTGTAIGEKNMMAFQAFVALVFVCLILDIVLLTGGIP